MVFVDLSIGRQAQRDVGLVLINFCHLE